MRRILCLTAVAFSALCVRADAGDSSAKSELPQLIGQLASKDYRLRDAAEKAILAFGPDALPALQQARSTENPEVRRRLDELIPPLERLLLLSAKRITLHMTNRTIQARAMITTYGSISAMIVPIPAFFW